MHGLPALMALLLYGVGLGFLANLLPRERHHGKRLARRRDLIGAPRFASLRCATSSARVGCR